ncbi:MAG: hypothetical protein WCL46_08760 [Chlorobium sp.]
MENNKIELDPLVKLLQTAKPELLITLITELALYRPDVRRSN